MKNGSLQLDITLAIPGLPFNGKTFNAQSLGGSESAGYYMARALAKLGHNVTVFCNTDRVRCEDVDYMPIGMFKQFCEFTIHDVCVIQRVPELYASNVRSRLSVLWCHDLAMGRSEDVFRGTAWNYDKLFVLSDFMRKQYLETYHLPEELLHQTRNGIDLEMIKRVREGLAGKLQRNPLSLVYSARPERGLDILLGEIMPRILQHEPNAKLYVSAYDNPATTQFQDFYQHCDRLAAQLGDRVVKLGALNKQQLYEVYQAAGVYVYPLPSQLVPDFDEISCISAMEAQGNGLPVVTSARGALPETVHRDAGILVSDAVHTPAYYDAFANAVLGLMRSPSRHRAMSEAGVQHAQSLGWDAVAKDWSELFVREISRATTDMATLANHFWRRSDIYAARECLSRLPKEDAKSAFVRERVEKDFAFIDSPDGFRRQYENIGGTHDERVLDWSKGEPRYVVMKQWLQRHEKVVSKVLDYGCAHGGYAINLLAELPHLNITGVDIDSHGIEMAYSFAEKLGVSSRWRGVVGDLDRLSDPNVLEMTEQYDAVIAQEVLEHVADPRALLLALESKVKDGGIVYLTVPFGPWEYSDYRRYPFRAHVREFDIHDLRELLESAKGKEANVTMQAMPYGHSPETGEALGWWVVQYLVTPSTRGKVGEIDMERKLKLQRPRQTVSLCMIAGPNSEETLHWCLRSALHIADEVVIADCGLSDEARRLIDSYKWGELTIAGLPAGQRSWMNIKVVPGVDPKTQGFETPRNMALQHCTQDWILWLDTDEKMLDAESLNKYLRNNIFQGYSICQHHLSVDANFGADMPVRLFRNNGKLRWVGMIHEHPEEAVNKGPGRTIVIHDVHIAHVGYLKESGRRQRFARNYPMLMADKAKYPNRILQKHMIMRDNCLLNTYELQQNGGKITPKMQERANEVIALHREFFLGKGHFTNANPLEYYSQACGLLGIGFDAALHISADKVDAKVNGVTKARFANMDDYLKEVNFLARESAKRYETKYY